MRSLGTPFGSGIGGLAWDGEALLVSQPGANLIHRLDPGTGQTTEFRRYTNHTYGIGFAASGELYGCQQLSRRIVRFNRDGSATPMPDRFADGGYHNMPRHLCVDARGRIWFSDPVYALPASGPPMPFPGHQSVVRLDQRADRSWLLRRLTFDTTSPSGVAVSPDQRTLYVADASERRAELRAYPIQPDGTLGPYGVLHAFGADHRGRHPGAEGVCVETDGTVVACAGGPDLGPGALVYRFSPTGRVLSTTPVREGKPTGCAVGDGTLYVGTTAGHVYAVR
ncbi:MAG TPA: SMP-30/gluconolactonase/LRE family protein [Chloroflexota bacterium]|nr:SMP-30/gluconolactonase/LRE family protein [Chloroflexota bacterium]